MPPNLKEIDHIHVFVADRAAAEKWYANVLGFNRVAELEFWAADGGPLTIGNSSGTVHLALFERPTVKCRSTVALGTSCSEFIAWRAHLTKVFGQPAEAVNHEVSWSLYFADPDGNPFEITSYEYAALVSQLQQDG